MMYVSFINQKNSSITAKLSTSVSTAKYPDTLKAIKPNKAWISIDGKAKNMPNNMLMMIHKLERADAGAGIN